MSDPIYRLNAAFEGRYRIKAELGEGGMAKVYLAEDLKHERKVALKVLKPELAAVVGAGRFLAEIKTTANLQHPHILPLHDSGEADSFLYYVMPYVEGESLRDRLDREHQLPVDDAVRIATTVAEALDYAHRHGVIHRDIKPANVLLQDGKPVIADFGIALAVEAVDGGRLTETGLSLGTPHYMSPEQATGDRNVGPATDIYALGCVLYEMLVGEPPFTGRTAQAVWGKIVSGVPAKIAEQRRFVPENVEAVVTRALEKVPADRFGTPGELARALGNTAYQWPPDAGSGSRRISRTIFAATLAVAIVMTLLWSRQFFAPATANTGGQQIELSFNLPEGQLLDLQSDPTLALSPDGTLLVYAAEIGVNRHLYVREVGQPGVRPLEGTEGATGPFFSPDGRSVGYFADGALHRVAVDGGIPVRIADVATPPEGASWGEDGTIIFARGSSMWQVAAAGGALQEIPLVLDTTGLSERADLLIPERINSARWPHSLPGPGRALLSISYGPRSLGVVDLASGRFRPLAIGDRPHYLSGGQVVFLAGEEPQVLAVARLDLDRLRLGPASPVVSDILKPAGSRRRFAASRSGALAWLPGGFDRSVVLVDRNGREEPLGLEMRGYRFPRVSPDGRHVSFTVSPTNNVWVVDLERRTAQPFTNGYDLVATWSPDGARLAFARAGVGIAWIPWPSGGEPTVIVPGGGGPLEWVSSDALLGRAELGATWDLTRIDAETGTATPWLATSAREWSARVSLDRGCVAYVSDATGVFEVYMRSITGGPATTVSNGGGTEPRWSRQRSEIFYRNGNAILAVPVRTDPGCDVAGPATRLFSAPYDFSNDNNWDVLPDDRFIMIRSEPNQGREVRFRFNWLTHNRAAGATADR